MQPQQPYYPPQNPSPSAGGPDYGFITNPAPPPKKSLLPSGNSPMQRALIFGGGLLVLIIIIVIFAAAMSGGGGNTAPFTAVAEEQNELVRVAKIGTQDAVGQNTKNFAISAQLSIGSAQKQLLDYLGQHGVKVSTKQLALKQNPQTDTQLTAAQSSSSFDETFRPIMKTQLDTYTQSLKTAYNGTSNEGIKQLMKDDFSGAQLLLQQLSAAQD